MGRLNSLLIFYYQEETEMEYKIEHIPKGKLRPGAILKAEYLTIHSTGNLRSNAKGEHAWLTNPTNDRIASYHIVIDENEAIEVIPLTEVAYHAGTNEGNRKSIGLEICESGDRTKTIGNAVQLVAKMLKEKGWGIDRMKRHFDWSGKICPGIMYENNWAEWKVFVAMVEKELQKKDESKLEVSIWAKNAAEWVVEQGISDGTRPKDPVTREELWTMLYRMRG